MPLSGRTDRAFALALVATSVARLPFRRLDGGQAHLTLAQEAVAALAIAALVVWQLARGGAIAFDRRDRAWWLVVALELGSAAFADNPLGALRPSGILLVAAAVYFVARTAGAAALWAPLPTLALVALGVFLEASGLWPGLSRRGHAPGGFLGERNLVAELLVLGLPLCAWYALGDEPRSRRAALVLLTTSSAAVILCRTRSAWLAGALLITLGAGLCAIGPATLRRRGLTALLAVGLGAGGALAAPTALHWSDRHPYRETLRHLADQRSASARGRAVQYDTSLDMLRAHPLLGVGPGGWTTRYLAFARPDDPTLSAAAFPVNRLPSSDLIAWACERGLPALLILALAAWRTSCGDDERRWLRRATLVALLPMCMLDAVLQLAPPALLLAWILGASAGPRAASPRRGATRLLAMALAVAASLAGARVVAFHAFVRARRADDLERAARLDPGDLSLRLALAEIEVAAERCDLARAHLAVLARRAAPMRAVEELTRRCR